MADLELRKYYPWFTLLGLLLGGLVAVAFYKDQFREWKVWQQKYIGMEVAKATNAEQRDTAARTRLEVLQMVLPELGRVDRCTTCHLTVEDPSYAGFPQPLAYHPNHAQHPFAKFGCTICHRGQGHATTREAAHGHVKHWDQPMLPMKYIEASCAKCHLPADVPGAPKLQRGQALFVESGCVGCHKLNGIGAAIGPELDGVGARHSAEWLAKHFREPAAVVPNSTMPSVNMSDEDLEALTLFMLGQTGDRLSDYHVSMRTIPGPQVGRRLFEQKGCFGCHSIGGQGGDVGPALDEVATRHEPEWIFRHFMDPQAVTPGTVMPKFDLTEQEIRALTEFLLSLTSPEMVGFLKMPTQMSPSERGKAVYKKYGCAGCHGPEGRGGVTYRDGEKVKEVPALSLISLGYSKEEIKDRTLGGQQVIAPFDPKLPAPPMYMPAWRGKVSEGEMNDLVEYLVSLADEG